MKSFIATILFVTLYVNVFSDYGDNNLVNVRYYLWMDDNITETYKINVKVPEGSKFYDVMVKAAEEDDHFKFVAVDVTWGKLIIEIGGKPAVAALKRYWWIFITDKPPTKNNPPGEKDISPFGVSNLVIEENKYYLFWLITAANFTHGS